MVGATMILDAGFGDSGKGRLAGYLARRHGFRHVVAGGTGVGGGHALGDASAAFCSQVPPGLVNADAALYIGPGTFVDHEALEAELERLAAYDVRRRLLVDRRCGLVPPDAMEREARAGLPALGLTFETGATAARSDHLWRCGRRTGDLESPAYQVGDVVAQINAVAAIEDVLVVGAHGTEYSLFKGDNYPLAVSDDCSAAATLARTGLAWRHLTRVIGVVNMAPTTTLDVPLPHELPREELVRRGWLSYGLVSGRERRIASQPSLEGISRFVLEEQPSELALGRMDMVCPDSAGARTREELGPVARRWVTRIERHVDVPVRHVGTGPGLDDVVPLSD